MWIFGIWFESSGALGDVAGYWATAVGDIFTADVLALYAPDVTVTTASVAEIDGTTGKQASRQDTELSLAGTSSNEALPFEVALVVTLRTALATKAGHGRFYMPAPDVTNVSGGLWATASISTIVTAVSNGLATMVSNGADPVIFHRSTLTSDPVTYFDIGNVPDVQRRRRDKLTVTRTQGTVSGLAGV